jgi:Sigma-70, region 4
MRLDDQAPAQHPPRRSWHLRPSRVSPTSQLKREQSPSPKFGPIPGNLCDLSKGYFVPTFLSSSLTCPARQSRLADDPITLEDLAAEFGVSRERVRQIEVRAFEKVQSAVRNRIGAMETRPSAPALQAH